MAKHRPDDRDHGDRDLKRPENDRLNERQEWVIAQLRSGKEIRLDHLTKQFPRSRPTARRDLVDLRDRGLIVFKGSPKTGAWRLKGH